MNAKIMSNISIRKLSGNTTLRNISYVAQCIFCDTVDTETGCHIIPVALL